MNVFQPLHRVEIFKETAPEQVRTNVWTLNYDGFDNSVLDALKSHAQDKTIIRKPPTKIITENEDDGLVKKTRQEQILRYEQRKTALLENKDLGDAYSTVFVAHIPVTATEEDLRKVFEKFGTVLKVTIIRRKKMKLGKTTHRRGYAFVVFENRTEAKRVVSQASTIGGGHIMSINGQRLVVDVERGRVVKNWIPRKLRK